MPIARLEDVIYSTPQLVAPSAVFLAWVILLITKPKWWSKETSVGRLVAVVGIGLGCWLVVMVALGLHP